MNERHNKVIMNNFHAEVLRPDIVSAKPDAEELRQGEMGRMMMNRIFKPLLLVVVLFTCLFSLQGMLWVGEAAAAATFQAAGATAGGQASVTAAWPVHAIDDVALLFIETTGAESPPMTTPSGFTAVTNSPQVTGTAAGDTKLSVFWARATSAAMADVVVGDAGDHTAAQILTFRGVINTGNPWNITGGGVKTPASTTLSATGVTTTIPNALVVVAASHDIDLASTTTYGTSTIWTNANLTALTERADYGIANGTGGGFGVATGTKATAGATGNTTASVSSSVNAFLTIALAPQPSVTWSAASQASANETNGVTMTVTATLSQASIATATIPFTVTGTATNGADYTITASPITINAGATTGTATITIVGDTIDEPNQTVILTMGTPTGASLGATTVHTATITDDDATPSVQWTAASQASPNETNGTTMTVTAQLSAATEVGTVSIPYTVTGTATGGGTDYTLAPASPLTIAPSATTGVATITIVGDLLIEAGGETVILTIGASPTNATRGVTFTHTATITDDDTNSTIVGVMSTSNATESGLNVQVAFGGDNNGNNSCSVQAYTDAGRTIPVGGAVAMTRSPSAGSPGPGTFTATLSSLPGGTLYYFRATFTDGDGYTAGSTVDGSGSTLFSQLMHVGSNLSTRYPAWGNGYKCDTCHQANATNIKRVRATVGGTGLTNAAGTPITGNAMALTSADGVSADFADNATTDKTCDTCHSSTTFYKRGVANATSGSPLLITGASPPHPADPACNKCHVHNRGFKAASGCILCHELANTYQVATAAPIIIDNTGAALRGEVYGGHLKLTVGENLATVTDWDVRCQACHDGHFTFNGVRIPENPTVGIDYIDGYIDLGGTATTGTTEAEICWNCHDAVGVSEWGTNTDSNGTATNYNFGTVYTSAAKTTQTSKWIGTYWVSANFTYKEGWLNNKPSVASPVNGTANAGSTHAVSSSGVSGIDAVNDIRCSYCHDVHNTANLKATVAGDVNGKPYLRGSWKGNPYKEDGAPRSGVTYTANNGYGLVPRGGATYSDYGGYFIDQNTTVTPNSLSWPAAGATGFAGLCELCHGNADNSFTTTEINGLNKFGAATDDWVGSNGHAASVLGGSGTGAANIFSLADRNSTAPTFGTGSGISAGNPAMANQQQSGGYAYSFRGYSGFTGEGWNVGPNATTQEIHYNSGYTWGATISAADPIDAGYHKFSCSKCHNPHASRLPRLMITNCLDTKNNTWDSSYMVPSTATANGNSMFPDISSASMPISQATSAQNCHRVRDPNYANSRGAGWNTITPW